MKTKHGQMEKLPLAQNTVQTFLAAYKSYSLYPEDHVFCRTNLEKFTTLLTAFLAEYEEFSLDIEKNGFFHEGENIFSGPPEESNPAYLLTRDGITRLDFFPGVEPAEITSLLTILNRHRSAGDESGGDIVISFWQAEFQHIEYEEVDIFALEAFNFDLGTLKVAPDDGSLPPPGIEVQTADSRNAGSEVESRTIAETPAEGAEQNQSLAQSETVTNLLRMENTLKVLEITPEEQSILQTYVREEEEKDYTNDIIDVLLIILITQKNKKHFQQVLDFLADVFVDTLDRGQFHLAYKLCSNILTIRNQLKAIRPWTLEVIDNFIASLSAQEHWAEISWVDNAHLLVLHKTHLNFLWHVLRLLTPDVIRTLGPMMAGIDMTDIHIRNELYELIENKSKKAPEILNELLAGGDEKMNLMLFPVVQNLGKADAAKICLRMTRHDSPEVRRTGLKGYFTYASFPDFENLFPVLNDEDDVVVGRLLDFLLSRAEKEVAESLLLRFLEQAVAEGVQHPHMFEYYKALSRCGSDRSVRVLKKILLESRFSEMFSNLNAVHKKGAALALRILGTDEALAILRKGVKSMRPDIRFACQFALEKVK